MSPTILRLLAALAMVLACTTIAAPPPHPISSFSEAKRLAAEVYADHHQTFYCGCRYNNKKRVDAESCGYQPRKNIKRGQRIEWEHVVPAHALGHTLQCWREPLCTDGKGRRFKGRRCCEKIDPRFQTMVSDLHNLVPAVGELNADRSNFSFSMLEGEARRYGQCDFEVDAPLRKVEPMPAIRGDIARIYFYMEQTYGLPISDKQRRLFTAWENEDPPDEWEQQRSARIAAIIERARTATTDASDTTR